MLPFEDFSNDFFENSENIPFASSIASKIDHLKELTKRSFSKKKTNGKALNLSHTGPEEKDGYIYSDRFLQNILNEDQSINLENLEILGNSYHKVIIEKAVDVGGPTKTFVSKLSAFLFNPKNGLFFKSSRGLMIPQKMLDSQIGLLLGFVVGKSFQKGLDLGAVLDSRLLNLALECSYKFDCSKSVRSYLQTIHPSNSDIFSRDRVMLKRIPHAQKKSILYEILDDYQHSADEKKYNNMLLDLKEWKFTTIHQKSNILEKSQHNESNVLYDEILKFNKVIDGDEEKRLLPADFDPYENADTVNNLPEIDDMIKFLFDYEEEYMQKWTEETVQFFKNMALSLDVCLKIEPLRYMKEELKSSLTGKIDSFRKHFLAKIEFRDGSGNDYPPHMVDSLFPGYQIDEATAVLQFFEALSDDQIKLYQMCACGAVLNMDLMGENEVFPVCFVDIQDTRYSIDYSGFIETNDEGNTFSHEQFVAVLKKIANAQRASLNIPDAIQPAINPREGGTFKSASLHTCFNRIDIHPMQGALQLYKTLFSVMNSKSGYTVG